MWEWQSSFLGRPLLHLLLNFLSLLLLSGIPACRHHLFFPSCLTHLWFSNSHAPPGVQSVLSNRSRLPFLAWTLACLCDEVIISCVLLPWTSVLWLAYVPRWSHFMIPCPRTHAPTVPIPGLGHELQLKLCSNPWNEHACFSTAPPIPWRPCMPLASAYLLQAFWMLQELCH